MELMTSLILQKYLDLNCKNNLDHQIGKLEEKFSIQLPEEYRFILKSLNFDFSKNYCRYPFYVELNERHYFSFGRFHMPKEVDLYTSLLGSSEEEIRQHDKFFKSYGLANCLDISWLLIFKSDLYEEMYLDCGETNSRGSLWIIDRNFNFDKNEFGVPYKETGIPMKIKIADSISQLLEISVSQRGQIPNEYKII